VESEPVTMSNFLDHAAENTPSSNDDTDEADPKPK
jgi:hypothetical protein